LDSLYSTSCRGNLTNQLLERSEFSFTREYVCFMCIILVYIYIYILMYYIGKSASYSPRVLYGRIESAIEVYFVFRKSRIACIDMYRCTYISSFKKKFNPR